MRCSAASWLVVGLLGCAGPARAPVVVVIPKAPADVRVAETRAASEPPPDRDALFGTWLETLAGHQCHDTTTVRVRDGELDVEARPCVGENIYETEEVRYADHALDVSFREERSGAIFRYHLVQTSRRELIGDLAIGTPGEAAPRVYPVTWTKPR